MFEINQHETLMTPYEIIADGHVVARMADIGHALIIIQQLQLEGFADIYLADEGRMIWDARVYIPSFDMRDWTPEQLQLAKDKIIEIVLEGWK